MAQIVFKTTGGVTAFLNTIGSAKVVLSSNVSRAIFTTNLKAPMVVSSNASVTNFITALALPVVKTPKSITTILTTADPNHLKELILQIGPLTTSTDYTYLNVPDATGNYDALTNQGGYNVLPAPYNEARPYRENVSLWVVYRIWDVYGDQIQFPDSQAQEHDPNYNYQLFFPTTTNADGEEEIIRGIYEVFLIAAPRFNETFTGGTFNADTTETYYLVYGTETNFSSVFAVGQFLYSVDAVGSLQKLEEIDHIFNDTILNLTGTSLYNPFVGARLLTSATDIDLTKVKNTMGQVQEFIEGMYTPVNGLLSTFTTTVSNLNSLYYIDPTTKNYVKMGLVYEVVSNTLLKMTEPTGSLPEAGYLLANTSEDISGLVNSGGVFDTILDPGGTQIVGTNTDFTLFSENQHLYAQNSVNGNLSYMGQILSIEDATNLTLTASLLFFPNPGYQLFASDVEFTISNTPVLGTGGSFDSVGSDTAYYEIYADANTDFTQLTVGHKLYVVNEDDVYVEVGDIHLLAQPYIRFETVLTTDVNVGDNIIDSEILLTLTYADGVFEEYDTGPFHNIEGSGTTFLTTAETDKYLFYKDLDTGNYIYMGQVFLVYDDTHLWMLDAPVGTATVVDGLYTSWTLNTETALYADYKGKANIIDIAEQYPGWYIDRVGIMIDDNVNNCLNRKRFDYVTAVMCGACSKDTYPSFYALYVAMLSAIEITEWDSAIGFYNEMKTICAEDSKQDCGC